MYRWQDVGVDHPDAVIGSRQRLVRAGGEIGVEAQAGRHGGLARIGHGQLHAQAGLAQHEPLLGAIGPRPVAGRVVVGEHHLAALGLLDRPGRAPALAVQGVRMVAQVRRQHDLAPLEREAAIGDAVAEWDQREARRQQGVRHPVHHRPQHVVSSHGESGDRAADLGGEHQAGLALFYGGHAFAPSSRFQSAAGAETADTFWRRTPFGSALTALHGQATQAQLRP